MKYRIRKLFALTLALSMLLSLIPLYGAAMIDEFEGLETVEEIPFEFVLEPGDLPRELLREAVLAPEDLPSCIDPELAEARGHVNRLYLQEPDDRTVMFQNRDGSKTVYLFSHPVKGMSASTVSSFEISGTRLSFTFSNAITSRVGVTLSNFNIGYAEVAYIPGGVLTEDGVNITEDVRDWARGESTVSALAYNISGEAAAEYAASVAVPDTDVAATAAAAPGITITPNDPAPLGGMTVMSISYSDLAGLMSFKNMSTNRYLAITTSSTPSLTTSVRIVASYSRWLVQYDSMRGYILCNFKDIHNTFIGRMAGQNTVTMGPKTSIDYVFGLTIVSTTDGTVTIGNNDYALNSTLSAYQRDSDDDAFPTACEWKIYSKENVTLATSVTALSSRRLEQKGVGFALDYTVNPSNATHYDVELYYAATNQPVERDTEVYEDDDYLYYINTPGVHTLYYKDMITGVTSGNFTIEVYGFPTFDSRDTYMIQPVNLPDQYLTMYINTGNTLQNELSLSAITYEKVGYGSNSGGPSQSEANYKESWESQSKTFTISAINNDPGNYCISATLTSSQNNDPQSLGSNSNDEFIGTYERLTLEDEEITNTINCSITIVDGEENIELCTKHIYNNYSQMRLWYVGDYYYILCGTNASSELLALKYVSIDNTHYSVVVAPLNITETAFRWTFSHVGVDVPLIKQTRDYVCGYTTLLQVMMGAGLDVTVNPNWIGSNGDTEQDLDAKMKTIACTVDDLDGEASQSSMASYANTLLSHSVITGKENITSISSIMCSDLTSGTNVNDAQLANFLMCSMETGFAPFFLTRKAYSPFKYTSGGAHYVTIAGVKYSDDDNPNNDFVILSNCHYTNAVFGVYVVSFEDFRDGWLYNNSTQDTPHLYLFSYTNGGN